MTKSDIFFIKWSVGITALLNKKDILDSALQNVKSFKMLTKFCNRAPFGIIIC